MYCQQCGRQLPDDGTSCPDCQQPTVTDDLACYQALIGEKNQHYYLRHFAYFDARGKTGTSWHWPACFATLGWLLYRKLWVSALLYCLLPCGVFVLYAIAATITPWLSVAICLGYLLFFFIAPPFYANALYYRHCRKQMARVRAKGDSRERQLGELRGRGGTSRVSVVLILLAAVALMGMVAAIALPAYQAYTLRLKNSEVEYIGRQTTMALAHYYSLNLTLPESLAQAGISPPASPLIRAMHLEPGSGELQIELNFTPLQGKTLRFTPEKEQDEVMSWRCHSPDIQPDYLSATCRHSAQE